MCKESWTSPTPDTVASHRAAGRRRYNAYRQKEADCRRVIVVNLLADMMIDRNVRYIERGIQAEIARILIVSPSTVSRDLRRLRQDGWIE